MPPSSGPDAAWITSRMQLARDAARRELDEGLSGVEIAHALSDSVDAAMREVLSYHFAQAGIGPGSGIAVLATGSFGRRELAPYSDLDLLFLCEKTPDGKVETLARSILMPLWDAKVDAGHAVRSVADGLGLPDKDLAAATALLDARFMVGNPKLAAEFLARYEARVVPSPTVSWRAFARNRPAGTRASAIPFSCLSLTSKAGRGGFAICVSAAGRRTRVLRYQAPRAWLNWGRCPCVRPRPWSRPSSSS